MSKSETNQYRGAAGRNFFDTDELLQRLLERALPKQGRGGAFERLSGLGELCGGRLGELIDAAHQDGRWPSLRRYDRWGTRVDEVVYCAEQREARRLALSHGVLPPTPLIERMAKAYLLNQNGEGGVTCPLAMTDGLVQLLESDGTPEQQERWLPLLRDLESPTPLTAGQFVTERQGGSTVSENETVAEPAADGTWRLTGLKWFCSNPGELWVTTAKPRGSHAVALFLMPRRRPDGSLNDCHIQRLKDLSGTRGKATGEVEYRGAYAELIGRAPYGLAILLRSVLRVSRIHVGAAGCAFMRRALIEARLYAENRQVLGRPLARMPHAENVLRRLEALWTAGLLAYFEELLALERETDAAEVLVPLLKVELSRLGTEAVRQARLLLAGNATLRDFSILPRLAEDALIQEIWEGTHPILAGHTLRALRRPVSRKAFLALATPPKSARGPAADAAREAGTRLDQLLENLPAGSAEERAPEGLKACALAWKALSTSLLLREGKDGQAQILASEPDGL